MAVVAQNVLANVVANYDSGHQPVNRSEIVNRWFPAIGIQTGMEVPLRLMFFRVVKSIDGGSARWGMKKGCHQNGALKARSQGGARYAVDAECLRDSMISLLLTPTWQKSGLMN